MADHEINWNEIEAERARLEIYVADLKEELALAKAALASLPTRAVGRQVGYRSKKLSVLHNKLATICAFDMIQKWRHIQKKHGRELKRENELPPDGPRQPRALIVEAACSKYPAASEEEVRNRINNLNADPEERTRYGGKVLFRFRTSEWLDRSDDYLDV